MVAPMVASARVFLGPHEAPHLLVPTLASKGVFLLPRLQESRHLTQAVHLFPSTHLGHRLDRRIAGVQQLRCLFSSPLALPQFQEHFRPGTLGPLDCHQSWFMPLLKRTQALSWRRQGLDPTLFFFFLY